MKRVLYPTVVFILTLAMTAGQLFFAPNSQAASRPFDPGYIISDAIFTNHTAMSADAIQRFLIAKGAHCQDGAAPCLKNFTEHGKSAGTIIAEAAQQHGINPQVLIVTLQKEVGLVTISQPGAWRYRTAMGYGCPDSTPGVCNSNYFGFTNQMQRAANMFRRIMAYDPTWYTPYSVGINNVLYHPNAACGSSRVNIANRATAALYSYTPYQPNAAALAAGYGTGDNCSAYGNRNFWLYFNDWFGSSTSSMLIQSPQSPAVYLQSGNTRYAIASWRIIDAYGLGRFGVTAVSDRYMNSLTDGGQLSTVFSNKAQPGPIYLADNGYRFGFSSHQQCLDWGFDRCTDSAWAKPLEPAIFDQMPHYGDLTSLMLHGSYVYRMQHGRKQPFLSHQARVDHGYGHIKHTPITNPLNAAQPQGFALPQNNSLLSVANTPTVYAYSDGRFYGLSQAALRGLMGHNTPLAHDSLSRYTVTPPTSTASVGYLVGLSNGTAYSFAEGKKIDVTAVKHNWPKAPIIDQLQPLLSRRPVDATAGPNSTYRTAAGTIFQLANQQWRGFYALHDYFALGHQTPLPADAQLLRDLAAGQPILAPGRGSLFHSTNAAPSLIFTTAVDGTACQIYSLPQLGLYGLRADAVQRLSTNTTKAPVLSTTVYDQTGTLHIRYQTTHTTIDPATLASRWGITQRLPLCSLHSDLLNQTPVTAPTPRFVRNEHSGIIYYGEAGRKRPIYSYQAFLRMGGNATNTHNVSLQFLTSSPEGVPIYK